MAANTFILLDHTPIHEALAQVKGLDPAPIIHAGLVTVILGGTAIALNRAYRGTTVQPSEKIFSFTNLMELAVSNLLSFMEGIMGEHARKFLPLIGTTAFFILLSNLMGSIPGFDSPTSNLNTTLACALVTVVTTHVVGFRVHGVKYIHHFLGPVWWLAWLILPIEIIGHLARVMSLSMRLFGNMFGDHLVLATFMGLVPILVPVVFMGMGIFVALVQTFVFSLLSMIYIAGALEEAH